MENFRTTEEFTTRPWCANPSAGDLHRHADDEDDDEDDDAGPTATTTKWMAYSLVHYQTWNLT